MSPSSRGAAERTRWGAIPPLSIVWRCPLDVSAYLTLGQQIEVGEHACPDCGRRLGGWSGYWRWVRGPGTDRLWIRRKRCSRCRCSHAVLPDFFAGTTPGRGRRDRSGAGARHRWRSGDASGGRAPGRAHDPGPRLAASLPSTRSGTGHGVRSAGGASGSGTCATERSRQ
jgi:hypothetical protein